MRVGRPSGGCGSTRRGGGSAERAVVRAPRFFPSSKTCRQGGAVLETRPRCVRAWTCPACGVEHDRDANVANLAALYRAIGSSPGYNAYGEPSGGAEAGASARHGSSKQESASGYLSIG
jgi:putative transposase